MTLMLKFISGKYKGGEFPLDKDVIVIGRHSDLDMQLAEDMVSRRHAKLTISGNNVILEDMGSTNGTFVNGNRIKKVKLKLNDRILIGTSIAKLVDTEDTGQNMQDAARSASNAVSGSIEDIPIPEVLQLLKTSRKTGVLKITAGSLVAEIQIHQGIIKDVIVENNDNDPKKILFRLLKLEKGFFEFEARNPSSFGERINAALDKIMLEAAKYEDEEGDEDLDILDLDEDDDFALDDFDDMSEISVKDDDILDIDDEVDDSDDIFNLDEDEDIQADIPSDDDFNLLDDLDDDFDLEDNNNSKAAKDEDIFNLDEDDDDPFSLDDLDDEPKKEQKKEEKEANDFNLDDLDDDDSFSLDDLDDEPKKEQKKEEKEVDDFNLDDLDDDDSFSLDDLDDEPKKEENKKQEKEVDDFNLDDLDDDDSFSLDDLDDEPKNEENKKQEKEVDDFNLDDLEEPENQEESLPDINLEELKKKFSPEDEFMLPLPLFSPLEELNKKELKVLQLVHNYSMISEIMENTELTEEETYAILNKLLEEDYIEQ